MAFLKRFACAACAASVLFAFGACSNVNPNATFMNINDGEYTVSEGYYNFAARYRQASLDIALGVYMGDDMWKTDMMGSGVPFEDTVKNDLVDEIKQRYVASTHAEEYGISISDTEKTRIKEAAARFVEDNKRSTLNMFTATEEIIENYLSWEYYYQKLRTNLMDNAVFTVNENEANQSTIKYAVIYTQPDTDPDTGEAIELTEEQLAEKRANAESLAAAPDYDAKAEELGLTPSTYSYTTTMDPTEDSSLGEEVIRTAQGLSDGQSVLVEVPDVGYYVIKMLESHDAAATQAKWDELAQASRTKHADDIFEGWIGELSWEVNQTVIDKIHFKPLFEDANAQAR